MTRAEQRVTALLALVTAGIVVNEVMTGDARLLVLLVIFGLILASLFLRQ